MSAIQSSSLQSFSELAVEVRTLLFIYASAAWARRHANIPDTTMLVEEIEKFWRTHQLHADAVSDPNRMTLLLEKHLEGVRLERARRPAMRIRTCRSRDTE